MPYLTELQVFDNSQELNPITGAMPPPKLVLYWERGRIISPPMSDLETTPDWAQPIVVRALELQRMKPPG